jgi:hypothetical protein
VLPYAGRPARLTLAPATPTEGSPALSHISSPAPRFVWRTTDVRTLLPVEGLEQITTTARHAADRRVLTPSSVTSRESVDVRAVDVLTVPGRIVAEELPWLHSMYHTAFRTLAEHAFGQRVETAREVSYGINLNVQQGDVMRYEAHVDSNPIGGLLYATTHAPGEGGELVVANRGDVRGIAAIDADASRVYPVAGHLVFFDARHHSHYVAPLSSGDAMRVVVAMNFYTAESPETERPADLSHHLYGNGSLSTKEAQHS